MTFTRLFYRRSTDFLWRSIGLCEKGTIITLSSNAERASTQSLHFSMIADRLQREVMGVTDGVSVDYVVSPMAVREELETTHCSQYIDRFLTGLVHLMFLPRSRMHFFHVNL